MSSLRNEFIDRNNRLAESLTSFKSLEDLQHILSSCHSLWTQITGLPAVCSRVVIEISIACNILITVVRVWLIVGHHSDESDVSQVYETAISRVNNCQHHGHSSENCPSNAKASTVCSTKKLDALKEITKSFSNKIDNASDLHQYLSIKNTANSKNPQSSVDEIYLSAYVLYTKKEFAECLTYLRDNIQHHLPEDINCLKLLIGNCYYELGKPHCSLYYYSQCMRDSICAVFAINNSSIVFETIGNIEAEMEMRQLVIEALRNRCSVITQVGHQTKVYYDGRRRALDNNDEENSLIMVAQYQLGRRALKCGRYSTAVDQLKTIINTDNLLLPSSLPPLSVLYLMLYTALRLQSSDNQLTQQEILDKLHNTLLSSSISTSLFSSEEIYKYLLFCKVLWLKADSLIDQSELTEARDCLVSCISFIDCVKEQTNDNVQEFKEMAINNLLYVNHQISTTST